VSVLNFTVCTQWRHKDAGFIKEVKVDA